MSTRNKRQSARMALHRVVLPYACYGVIVEDGIIVDAAPIARWAVGRTLESFELWVKRNGGKINGKLHKTNL